MGRLLINCDLGENESDAQTHALLGLVDVANICCGVHAGSAAKTERSLALAAAAGVRVAAHPGLAMAAGRGSALPGATAFGESLKRQVTDFYELADRQGVRVDAIKLHGSLYHAVEAEPDYAAAYLGFLESFPQRLTVLTLAGGAFQAQLALHGIAAWPEVFADRAYRHDGGLVSRSLPGAVLKPDIALARFRRWLDSSDMETDDGPAIPLTAATVCVHSDSPDALALLSMLRNCLAELRAVRDC